MASKSIAKRPNNRWRARYRDDAGKEHAKHFDRKVDAQRWLDEVTTSIVSGQYVDPNAGRMTFRTYAEEWRASQPHRVTTQARTKSALENQAYPWLGDRMLSEIRPSEVQAWVAKLSAKNLSPATVHVIHGVVSGIFKAAVRDRRVASNPCEATKLPRKERKQVTPITMEQLDRLADEVPEHLRALILFTAGTGLRQGEAFGLTVDRVDFLRRTVRVDRQVQPLEGAGWEFRPTKTSSSVRTIPLPRTTLETLSAHLAAHPAGQHGLVFGDVDGEPLRRSSFGQTIWHPARKRAGLPEGVTFHDLRHLYASLLIRHGESVKVVQARLGHADASETLNTYSHLWPDSDDTTRAAVDAAFEGFGGGAVALSS
ncbi:integrase [Aeromicrobium sp. Root495]|uniref:tyrosine-type recombinase/integrase n=1 Tax=Aeromicrobium sp. Root495 TaxID=1736550 RepID=UPI0006FD75E5|nr:site-specific integrase [Aeromicrobium sp. Root495]KQY58889.1 integrase [Aeromicrobium sp. Root495]